MPFLWYQFSHRCCHRIARGSMFLISEISPLISKVQCYVSTILYIWSWPNLSSSGHHNSLEYMIYYLITSMLSSELSEVINSLRKSSNSSPSMKPLPVVILLLLSFFYRNGFKIEKKTVPPDSYGNLQPIFKHHKELWKK